VITMFPAGEHVLAAYRDGLLAAAAPGTLFIDSSTIAVDDAVQAAEMAHEAGHLALDAPVSGGTAGAEKGALTFMVGGSQEAFDTATPLFEIMGHQIVHGGDSGSGQEVKIVNNMALAIITIARAETLRSIEILVLINQVLYN